MNFANNVIIRDASGIFRSKREVIDLASEGAMEIEGGEEEGEYDVCAQHIWLQTTVALYHTSTYILTYC